MSIACAKNQRLLALLAEAGREARAKHHQSNEPERVFADLTYRTKDSWSRSRRVVGKAEYAREQYFPRFVVTSLQAPCAEELESGADGESGEESLSVEAQELYEDWYCPRGQMENHIKEQQLDLFGDRLSSTTFDGNQMRMFLVGLSHLILGDFRRAVLVGTSLAKARCRSIRNKLLCVAATLGISSRRIVLALDSEYPRQALFMQLYSRVVGPQLSLGMGD